MLCTTEEHRKAQPSRIARLITFSFYAWLFMYFLAILATIVMQSEISLVLIGYDVAMQIRGGGGFRLLLLQRNPLSLWCLETCSWQRGPLA